MGRFPQIRTAGAPSRGSRRRTRHAIIGDLICGGKAQTDSKPGKRAVERPWKRKFLGFSFLSNRQTNVRIAPKTRS